MLRTGLRRLVPLLGGLLVGACAGSGSREGAPVAPCTEFCSHYEEGYQWARNGNLSDEAYCEGYPEPFLDGCRQGVSDLNRMRPAREGLR